MDKLLVKKVLTFKSGQFVFSRRYDRAALESLLLEARVLKETVADLPVLPWLASKLEEEVIRRAIHSTAALEGNPLNEEQVGRVLTENDQTQAATWAELEIRNLKTAYIIVRHDIFGEVEELLGEEAIKRIHGDITAGIVHQHNQPGHYRDHLVKVGDREHGGVYTPPKILLDIQNLMQEFIAWINSSALCNEEPIIRAALAHFHLAKIHPFGDGNGRTARLVEAMCLRAHGLGHVPVMLSNYYYRHMDDYYWAFSRAECHRDHDTTAFVKFVLQAFIDACYEIKQRMLGTLRRFAMRDFLAYLLHEKRLNQRQHGLAAQMLINPEPFGLDDLFRDPRFAALYAKVSERTARRDLARLGQENLLAQDESGRYQLSTKAIENR
ncbi:MAG: Fic family protein [Pseudomonadota bacterium]